MIQNCLHNGLLLEKKQGPGPRKRYMQICAPEDSPGWDSDTPDVGLQHHPFVYIGEADLPDYLQSGKLTDVMDIRASRDPVQTQRWPSFDRCVFGNLM